jgi:hypothetical protein
MGKGDLVQRSMAYRWSITARCRFNSRDDATKQERFTLPRVAL